MKSSFPYTKILYKKKFRKKELLFTSFPHSYLLNCSVHFQRKKKKIFNVQTTFIIQIKNYKANIDTNKELELSVQTFEQHDIFHHTYLLVIPDYVTQSWVPLKIYFTTNIKVIF